MSFDQYSITLVLSMMRGMSYMPGLGLGRRQQGPREFTITVDHDISYGLGYIPTADDARHMTRLRRERVRARMSGIPFDYPLRPYTFQLVVSILPEDHSMHLAKRELTMFQRWLRFRAFSTPKTDLFEF